MSRHPVTLGAVNVTAQDPATLAAFWASVTGATPSAGGDTVYLPATGPGGFAMFFQPMTHPRPEHQIFHLDLTVPWGSRQPEVERLWDVLEEVPHVQWTTMSDPGGEPLLYRRAPTGDAADLTASPAGELGAFVKPASRCGGSGSQRRVAVPDRRRRHGRA